MLYLAAGSLSSEKQRALLHQNTQEVMYSSVYPWQQPCRDVSALVFFGSQWFLPRHETPQSLISRPVLTSYILFQIYLQSQTSRKSLYRILHLKLYEGNYEQCLPLQNSLPQLWVIARVLLCSSYSVLSSL